MGELRLCPLFLLLLFGVFWFVLAVKSTSLCASTTFTITNGSVCTGVCAKEGTEPHRKKKKQRNTVM